MAIYHVAEGIRAINRIGCNIVCVCERKEPAAAEPEREAKGEARTKEGPATGESICCGHVFTPVVTGQVEMFCGGRAAAMWVRHDVVPNVNIAVVLQQHAPAQLS